jgi:hypothetical protein
MRVEYAPDERWDRLAVSPIVMTNEQTDEQGKCEELVAAEDYLHPVHRGDL